MARWVQANLGLHKEMEIDRIDNSGHYEANNLRYVTPSQNIANSRGDRVSAQFHAFKLKYPEVTYADITLRTFFYQGMTPTQIVERFYRPSRKPKGVYGTFSTPDPVIASQLKDS